MTPVNVSEAEWRGRMGWDEVLVVQTRCGVRSVSGVRNIISAPLCGSLSLERIRLDRNMEGSLNRRELKSSTPYFIGTLTYSQKLEKKHLHLTVL